jgi:cathepsin X
MQAEILARGPIACTIAVTSEFLAYTGGVFEDKTGKISLDHEISITGWGVDSGKPYWVVRNSWGTYWYVIALIL